MDQLRALETPCLLLDRAVMERNIHRLHRRLRTAGVPLRPHLKTTKCVEIARLLVRDQPGGVTVSTLAEAGRFSASGFQDILYAVAIAPNKLAHAAALRRSGTMLSLLLDSADAARAAGAAATRDGLTFPVLIELDVDGHRSGVSPDPSVLVSLARAIHAIPGLALRGLLTHAGSAYDGTSVSAITAIAELERSTMTAAAATLRDAGLPCPTVSVGSTPTALAAQSYEGVTEVRAGVFAFNDLMQVRLCVCSVEDIAISVLTTVIGHYAPKNRMIVDAGWTALSQDSLRHSGVLIFGYVCDDAGQPLEDLVLTALNQEHGIVTRLSGGTIDSGRLPIGTTLRILPVHACSTAAAHDRYYVLDESAQIVAAWPRFGGWTESG
jgi:D-serine deaminase-like pyridoxal phosphate-dependent protein